MCRVRPARVEEENKLLCKICMGRRHGHTEGFTVEEVALQTPMLEEIADSNGRVAMIVAKFGLREWLNGSMVRTCFITQPDAIKKTIEALGHVREEPLKKDGEDRQEWFRSRGEYRYEQMVEDFGKCRRKEDSRPLFLYGARNEAWTVEQ